MVRCMDLTLRSKEKSQSASEVSSTVPWWTKPAALNSTSTGPSRFASASMAAVSRASSFTHSATPASFRPAIAASLRSLAITLAPSRAKAMAVARPMPAPEAVQKASLPLSRSVILASSREEPCWRGQYGGAAHLATSYAAVRGANIADGALPVPDAYASAGAGVRLARGGGGSALEDGRGLASLTVR